MKHLWNKRRLAGLGAVAAVVGMTLWVVVPALATSPGHPVPPASLAGVTPTDIAVGGNGNCSNLFPDGFDGQTVSEYDNKNPRTATGLRSGNKDGVMFSIQMNPPNGGAWPAYDTDKYFNFTASGAAVLGVGVNGGSDSTVYDYFADLHHGVAQDGYLHAPAQSTVSAEDPTPTQLYSVSHLVFCYVLADTISGVVYQDYNENGTNDTGDSGLSGWSVSLYQGSNTSPLVTTTTASDGSYAFAAPIGSSHTVCVAPQTAPAGQVWAQTQPLSTGPNFGDCTGKSVSELPNGYQLSSGSGAVADKNFGNVLGYECNDTSPFGPSGYQIQLASCDGKTAPFVFNSGTTSDGDLFVSVTSDNNTATKVPLVEKITWPTSENQVTVKYTDIAPFRTSNLHDMRFCQLDPRSGEMTLEPTYATQAGAADVLQLPTDSTGADPESTSCLISIEEPAGGTSVAYVYSLVDGLRTIG